jgi:hypothetical protein
VKRSQARLLQPVIGLGHQGQSNAVVIAVAVSYEGIKYRARWVRAKRMGFADLVPPDDGGGNATVVKFGGTRE